MKRRARLRLRGVWRLDGALRWKLGLDAAERAELGACCHGSHADIPIGAAIAVDAAGAAQGFTDEAARVGGGCADTAVDAAVPAPDIFDELARVALGLRVGIGTSTAMLAPRSAAIDRDHGRALRALRTTRARRLAIALALARGTRLE
jgi:hypothetical protein